MNSSSPSPQPTALQVETFVCGPLQTNSYLVIDREAQQFVVIDPSIESDEVQTRARKLESDGFQLTEIWNTHGHFDHVYDNAKWKAEFGVPILAHPADAIFLEHLREQALWFGLPAPAIALLDRDLSAADILKVGGHEVKVLELPGHSPGSVGFDFGPFIVGGDVLFQGSVGRTDLPGCSEADLAASVRHLFTLKPATEILPGHGSKTTVEAEIRSNAVAAQLLAQNP